ncbi:hypothetical protein [Streptomyces sp. KL116D]|uniref:hypothetical protein n=1 Tax=Streptomyces sp. KL116D TaxID=3045152 RepID=UPI0035567B58
MTTYTDAVYENGILAKLADVLAVARARTPQTPARDEIDRVVRWLNSGAAMSAAMPVATLAALVDLVAEEFSQGAEARLPQPFMSQLALAAGDSDVLDFLGATSVMLRASQRDGARRFDDLPLAPWEAELRFAHLHAFAWWVEGDEYDSFEDGVLAGVASEHPYGCADLLPALIAECHAVLLLEADEASSAALRSVVPWATGPVTREILRLASAHLEDH